MISALSDLRNVCVLVVIFALASSSSGFATGGVWCSTENKSASLWISLGRLPIYAPLSAGAEYGDQRWSSSPADGEIQLGESQGFWDKDRLLVDFADDNIEKIIISLRVDMMPRLETESGFPGTLKFEDGISHMVQCEFE